jgi:hypothetical protein
MRELTLYFQQALFKQTDSLWSLCKTVAQFGNLSLCRLGALC